MSFFINAAVLTNILLFDILISILAVVTLLDYGAGNVRSVRNAIRCLGFGIKDVSFRFNSFLLY